MVGETIVDTSFDVRTDAGGRDPDSHSRILRRYHQLLWGKTLPGGARFELDDRLHHVSDLGEFWLSSDAITHTYLNRTSPERLFRTVRQVPQEETTAFFDLGCTIGAFLVFPSQKKVDDRWRRSINQCRGMHPRIQDRFDLTLECIRRHYLGQDSPLSTCLAVYEDFFALFGSFRGYVEHFLLQDLVDPTFTSIRFLRGAGDFTEDPLPAADVDDYREYMTRSMAFIRSRNTRIAAYAGAHVR